MIDYKDLLKELLQDEEIRLEYEFRKEREKLIDEEIAYRKRAGMTQAEFASKIGVQQQTISRFEKGEIDPRYSFVSKLLKGMEKETIFVSRGYMRLENIESKILMKPKVVAKMRTKKRK